MTQCHANSEGAEGGPISFFANSGPSPLGKKFNPPLTQAYTYRKLIMRVEAVRELIA